MAVSNTAQVYFVVAVDVEIDANGKSKVVGANLDDERAVALFQGADVWVEEAKEWFEFDDYSVVGDQATKALSTALKSVKGE